MSDCKFFILKYVFLRSSFVQSLHIFLNLFQKCCVSAYIFLLKLNIAKRIHISSALGPETEKEIKIGEKNCFDLSFSKVDLGARISETPEGIQKP